MAYMLAIICRPCVRQLVGIQSWKKQQRTRLIKTARAPAALKQLRVCAFVGG